MLRPKNLLECASSLDKSCYTTAGPNDGEDELSFSRNSQQLTAELSKRYPRPDFVKGLLSTTHNQRRGLISASVDSVNTIMGQHPFLKQPRWVTAKSSSIFSIVFGILFMIQMIEEFKLMVGEREVESMEDKWKMVLPKLLDGTEELPAYTEEQQWQAVQLLDKNSEETEFMPRGTP